MKENFWEKRKTLKRFDHFKKHLIHQMHIDDDILPEDVKQRLDEVIIEAESLDRNNMQTINNFLGSAHERVLKIMPARSSLLVREWLDILLVAFMVAFGIRALFLQPFKIPTSSMQPTLFGIHYINGENSMPRLPGIANFFIHGVERAKLEVKEPGVFYPESEREYNKFGILPWTSLRIGNVIYKLPGKASKVNKYCELEAPSFKKDEVLCDGWLSTGDHLFVDRFSHHFTGLKRGDVTVFNTEGLVYGTQRLVNRGYYYIKRLVGLPGDTLRINNDMVYVTPAGETVERPITELCPAFEKIYSRKGGYHGHLNSSGAQYLGNPDVTFTVPEDSYFMMGDNSNSSLDSRYFGAVPRANIVGKGFFVFWPVSRRWGLVDSKGPLDVPTRVGFPSMHQQ